MRIAVRNLFSAGGRRARAAAIAVRRGVWRATRPVARQGGEGRQRAIPQDDGSRTDAGAVHRRRGPQRPWLLASLLGIAGLIVLAVLHLSGLGDAPPGDATASVSEHAAPAAAPQPPAEWPQPVDFEEFRAGEPALVDIEPRRPLEPEPAFDSADLALELIVAEPIPAPAIERVADAGDRFFVTSATDPGPAHSEDFAPADEGWRLAVPFADRAPAADDVRTIAFAQSSASAAAATTVGPSPLVLAGEAPAASCVGAPAEVMLRVTNSGEAAAEEVLLRVDLPEGLAHRHGRSLDQPLGGLEPGETRDVKLVVTPERAGEFSIAACLVAAGIEGNAIEVMLRTDAASPRAPDGPSASPPPPWCDCAP